MLLVIAFAGYLVLHRDALALAGRRVVFIDLPRGRDLGPILAMFGVSMMILVAQNDLGSSLLFFGLFLVMLYVATERAGWLVVGGRAVRRPARWRRTPSSATCRTASTSGSHPLDYYDETPGSYQLGRGDVRHGLGRPDRSRTRQRVPRAGHRSPSPTSSSSTIGEELGLTAVMAVILCYGLIVERALRIALISRDGFGKLLAVGLGSIVALQVFVVIGGVTGLIPLTGLTTPFLSYGGSSLVANWVIIALLLRISDQARRPAPRLEPADDSSDDSETTQVVKLR